MKGFCLKHGEVELNVLEREETYPVKGEPTTIKAKVCVCSECGEEVWDKETDDENLRSAYSLYRSRHGLLQPSEILAIREKYGLSQVAFARVLGFGDKTIARYENGSIQDEAHNNLLMLMRDADNFIVLYDKNKQKLTCEERYKVESNRFKFTLPRSMKYRPYNTEYGFTKLTKAKNIIIYPGMEEKIG